MTESELARIDAEVSDCRRCARLVAWREQVASEKRASFRDQDYWGRGVPSFGPAQARILALGLAPAAHGANRTGRMFTGDRSGDFLYRALFEAGLANQPGSSGADDGLELRGVRVTSVVRCAPPANRPTTSERDACLPYLRHELAALAELRVVVCLGSYAWENAARELGLRPRPKFGHGVEVETAELGEIGELGETDGGLILLGSYHPSQRNTFTGLLTQEMLSDLFRRAAALAELR